MLMVRLRGNHRWLAFAAILLTIALLAALRQTDWTQPAGEPFKVTLLQGNIPQDAKWQSEYKLSTLNMYADMTREHWDSRLIVWPETAVTVYYHQVRDSHFAPLEAEARSHGADLLMGLPVSDQQTPHHYYNALAGLGRTPGFYFKRHRVPFGEYLPLRPVFGWVLEILDIPMADFSAGPDRQPPIVAAGYPLAASICFEDIFSHEARAALPEAAYLVNVTNDAWFGDSMAPHQHVQMARMRAIESGRYMARASNSGITAIIGPKGEVLARAPMFVKTTLTGSIRPMQGRTPYVLWGDAAVFALVLTVLGMAIWLSRRGKGFL